MGIKRLIFLSIILLFLINLFCQDTSIKYDSSNVHVRTLSEESITNFKVKRDFQYLTIPPAQSNIISRIFNRIFRFFSRSLGRINITKQFIYIVFTALLIFFIVMFARSKFNKPLSSEKVIDPLNVIELNENIEDIDFDKTIQECITFKKYREATRFMFLKLLKLLNHKNYIKLEKDKTNNHYLSELKQTPYANIFKELAYIYEYVWYGKFSIEDKLFEKISSKFNPSFNQFNE